MTDQHTSSPRSPGRSVDPDELRQLGFDEAVIEETLAASQRGVFALEPSEDLVRRTIAACETAYPDEFKVKSSTFADFGALFSKARNLNPEHWQFLLDHRMLNRLSMSVQAARTMPCIPMTTTSGPPAVGNRASLSGRPLVVIDNQNLISPELWVKDIDLLWIQNLISMANESPINQSCKPAARVIVMRNNVKDYNDDELNAFGAILNHEQGDVWCVPSQTELLKDIPGCIISGDTAVDLTVDKAHGNDVACAESFREADAMLSKFDDLLSFAVPVKRNAELLIGKQKQLTSLGGMQKMVHQIVIQASNLATDSI